MTARARRFRLLPLLGALAACDPGGLGDGVDSGRFDSGLPDAGDRDSGSPDAGNPDGGAPDSGQVDGGQLDSGGPDSGATDSGATDSGVQDAGPGDAGRADAGFDGGSPDAGPPDAGCAPVWNFGTPSNLSQADQTALTGFLETLSSSWVQTAVDGANNIVAKTAYGAPEMTGFFIDYFVTTQHPYTDALGDYLGYPTFYWFDATVHLKLQRALAVALWLRATAMTPTTPTAMTALLQSDAGTRGTLFNAHRFFASVGKLAQLPVSERSALFDRYQALTTACAPAILGQSALNIASYPWVPAWRTQVWMSFRDMLPLDAGTKATLAQALNLSGAHLNLWNTHNTLLYDNNGFSTAQKTVITNVLDAIPAGLLDLGGISQNEFLGNVAPRAVSFQTRSGVNIFNFAIGAVTENSFPSDIAASNVDVFASALAHESNHIIDALVVEPSTTLKARKVALLSRAGTVDLQYLRSQVGGTFFQNAPQEFVASISNEWFTDTARTLALAVARFGSNYHEPMNQFLFFAELYSQGGNTTRFYRIDTSANVTVTDVPVTRDSSGRITQLTYGGKSYTLTLDAQGFATAVTVL